MECFVISEIEKFNLLNSRVCGCWCGTISTLIDQPNQTNQTVRQNMFWVRPPDEMFKCNYNASYN